MDFQKLVEVYEQLEKTASGNMMREILAELFKTVPKEEIAQICYLTLGQISSEYERVVLGLAEKSVLKAITAAAGLEPEKVQKIMNETGDVGLTAEKVLQKKPRTLVPVGKLTVHEFSEKLHAIAAMSGTGSQEQKTAVLVSLLQKSPPSGAKYITRMVLGTLRLGAADMTLLDALAIAFTGEKKNKELLEKAYNVCPDVGIIAETLVKEGLKGIEKINVHVGRPVQMMLAQRVDELDEAADKIPGELIVEAKYDGERVQAHKDKKGRVMLYSRRLENITLQFPDIVKYLQEYVKAKEFVLEGEILPIDKEGKPLPFQVLMQRRRKHEIEKYQQEVPVQLKVFDLLYLNGKALLHQPLQKRVGELLAILSKNKYIMLAERIKTEEMSEVDVFFQKMLKNGFEGIMIKSKDSEYQAGTRGWNWIKWKKEYVQEMVDTLDLAIVGAFHGRGKRSGMYGALLCACYNSTEDMFETVCKLGTGLKDEVLAALPKKLARYKVDKKPARLRIKKEMEPDVWFEPKVVVEIFGAEITQSPFHTAGSGLALRFPRFIRFREDKDAEQATTTKEVEQMAKK